MPKIDRDLPPIRRVLAYTILSLLPLTRPLAAVEAPPAPTVFQVLAACERGYANGNQGLDAAMCEWYANPCGCKPGLAGPDGPRWCIPVGEPAADTVRKVIAELRRQPDPAALVDRIVPAILEQLYPCQPGAGD